MDGGLGSRCKELGSYMVEQQCTIRQAAAEKGISKTTVHKEVTERLKFWDYDLYVKVRKLLEKNKAEMHIRGGRATGSKYKK